jgi:hypothetical protein
MNEYTQRTEKHESNIDKAVSTAREKTAPVREEMREKGNQLATEAKSAVHEAGEQTKTALGSQKEAAARQLHGLADSLRQTSRHLREQDQGTFASYSNQAAHQIERASEYLEDRDLDELMHDAEDFARRQPELFIGGAFTLGLLAARFLRSSAPEPMERERDYYPVTRQRETAVARTNY